MTIIVKVGDAKNDLADLLTKVEAGEEVIIARGNQPIARLSRIAQTLDITSIITEIKAARAGRPVTTADELRAWRDEGRRLE